MPEVSPWNERVVTEFRANCGQVGGEYSGYLMILVHNVGARSGRSRINPLVYQAVGKDFALFASKRGAPRHPDWYYNLRANPDTVVEVGTATGTEVIEVRAREAEGRSARGSGRPRRRRCRSSASTRPSPAGSSPSSCWNASDPAGRRALQPA